MSKGDMTSAGITNWESEGHHILLLTACLPGANELGCALETALKPNPTVEVVRENLPADTSSSWPVVLQGLFKKFQPHLVLLCLPAEENFDFEPVFDAVRNRQPHLAIIAILESSPLERLHQLNRLGAADFCLAPLRLEDLLPRIHRWSRASSKPNGLARQLEMSLGMHQFLGRSPAFLDAIGNIPKFAGNDASVLITGETGTGKEMCARAIHHLGPRADHPFIPLNCGAIPSELVENELFGHHAGAFTGASSSVQGLVYEAEGGTLFLDEIDSLPTATQVKFLRFLQDQEYRPLGARKASRADIRIIAASNADLAREVQLGKFRSDLFYRLNVLPLKLPSLRERRSDIPLLARHFVAKYAAECRVPARELSRAAVEKLGAYEWPGNVRELENIIERAVVLSEQPMITAEDICLPTQAGVEEASFKALKERAIAEFESGYIRRVLAANEGNISKASRAAKKNRRAFWQLMRKHAIANPTALPLSDTRTNTRTR